MTTPSLDLGERLPSPRPAARAHERLPARAPELPAHASDPERTACARILGPPALPRLALALALTACGAREAPSVDTAPAAPAHSDMPAIAGPNAQGAKDMPPSAGLNEHDVRDMPVSAGPGTQRPEDMSPETCQQAQDPLGDLEWIPRDVRLAAAFDLGDPGLGEAARELARASAATPGMPVVAALGLGFLDAQLDIVRRQLAAADLAPRELLLLHDPAGAVVWVVRVRCDLLVLQAVLARAWGVTSRATAAGPLAEPAAPGGFPHDVVFLADDRLALVPAGAGGKLRRWLEGQAAAPELGGGGRVETPGEALARLDPAPIRVVLAGRGLLAGDAPAAPRTLRAWPDRVALDAAPPG